MPFKERKKTIHKNIIIAIIFIRFVGLSYIEESVTAAVLRKRIKWPRKRISKYYEKRMKKVYENASKKSTKRIDLKIEDKSYLAYYVQRTSEDPMRR